MSKKMIRIEKPAGESSPGNDAVPSNKSAGVGILFYAMIVSAYIFSFASFGLLMIHK